VHPVLTLSHYLTCGDAIELEPRDEMVAAVAMPAYGCHHI
jgi:hypothetical protein